MLQQMDLLFAHSQPVQFSWTWQQMDLLVWLETTCIVQMDAVADRLVICTWTLYFNVTIHLVQMDDVSDGLAICTWTLYFNVSM